MTTGRALLANRSHHARDPGGPLPTFLLLGAQKCWTTSLARMLSAHPDVFIPRKELHHFGKVPDAEAGGLNYRAYFAEWNGEPQTGEATPAYLYLPDAARQIARSLPEARFLVSLRNPVDRAYSAYGHAVRRGLCHTSFERALLDEPRYLALGQWAWAMVDRGRYLRQLQRYERLVGRERLHVVLTNDLAERRQETLDGIASFLGLSSFAWPPMTRVNENMQSPIPRFTRRFLTKRQNASRLAWRLNHRALRTYDAPPMAPFTRRMLLDSFRDENLALGDWLGRDLSAWNR